MSGAAGRQTSPQRLSPTQERLIVGLRLASGWGPVRIAAYLGFCAMSEVVDLVYKVGSYCDLGTERGIAWHDRGPRARDSLTDRPPDRV